MTAWIAQPMSDAGSISCPGRQSSAPEDGSKVRRSPWPGARGARVAVEATCPASSWPVDVPAGRVANGIKRVPGQGRRGSEGSVVQRRCAGRWRASTNARSGEVRTRRETLRGRRVRCPSGARPRQLDAHEAIRQSPEQAGRPAVRAHTVSRISAVVTLRAPRKATFLLAKHNPLMPLAGWPALQGRFAPKRPQEFLRPVAA
jgi:hypothetical protein